MKQVVKLNPDADTVQYVAPAVTPMQMLQLAVERGADIDKLQQLMDLNDRWEAAQSRKSFTAAMTAFKATPPDIVKTKAVGFGKTSYKHATLADVCDAAIKGLADVGVSHRWDINQVDGRITVTCVLTHQQGYSESTSMSAPADDSGSKNPIQAIASAVTYLQRYTLLAATGLAAKDQIDTDGVPPPAPAYAPEGYANWKLDMEAVAEEGVETLRSAWEKSLLDLRNWALKNDRDWWAATKAKAKVQA
jgi:hypothetical protein